MRSTKTSTAPVGRTAGSRRSAGRRAVPGAGPGVRRGPALRVGFVSALGVRRGAALAVGLGVSLGSALPAQDRKPGKRSATVPQYKRVHQGILRKLLNGRIAKARAALAAALKRDGADPETWFQKTVLEVAEGENDAALASMSNALELGLPPERFLAGPRELFAPIADSAPFRMLQKAFAHRPVHGPLLGSMTDGSVRVWLRTAKPCAVEVLVRARDHTAKGTRGGSAKAPAQPIVAKGATTAAADFTAIVEVTGLQAATRYDYKVRIAGGEPVGGGTFRTFPREGNPCRIKLAFGGGSGYVPANERMWNTVASFEPDLLLLLGDNVYIDAPKRRAMQRYCYYRRQSRPEFRRLVANVPVFAIWDDHDFGTNDCFYGSAVDTPPFKKKVLQVFRQNWANPGYGRPKTPGCFQDFKIGDLFFLMLDGRYYRSDPKGENPTMLGEQQANWVKYRMIEVRATFKTMCSPVPWTFQAKGNSRDTWNGFRDERNGIFELLGGYRTEGILLLSADRHRTDIWKIPRAKHYPFLEFSSSRLTNQHVHKTMPKAEFSYNEKQSFGLVEYDTFDEDPKITLKVVDIDGKVVHTRTMRFSDLCYK